MLARRNASDTEDGKVERLRFIARWQGRAVMAALSAADQPRDSAALAASFRQGRRIEPKVRAVLQAVSRLGFIAAADGRQRYAVRRTP